MENPLKWIIQGTHFLGNLQTVRCCFFSCHISTTTADSQANYNLTVYGMPEIWLEGQCRLSLRTKYSQYMSEYLSFNKDSLTKRTKTKHLFCYSGSKPIGQVQPSNRFHGHLSLCKTKVLLLSGYLLQLAMEPKAYLQMMKHDYLVEIIGICSARQSLILKYRVYPIKWLILPEIP